MNTETTINALATAATNDNGAAAAFTDAVTEAAMDAGQPVAGFTTTQPLKQWFADMLHAWLELAPAVALAPDL